MTINIPDGVITTFDQLDARGDDYNAEQRKLAQWVVNAHPVEREQVLRSRLNDPANRAEYIDADLFGNDAVDLLWDGGGATDVVGGAGPWPVGLGNLEFPTRSVAYREGILERWPSATWARYAPLFAKGDPNKLLAIVRRRHHFHPGEFTRLDTLKAKGGDYGAPDWVHESGNDDVAIWEVYAGHGWQRRLA